jgi:hypothetical protein
MRDDTNMSSQNSISKDEGMMQMFRIALGKAGFTRTWEKSRQKDNTGFGMVYADPNGERKLAEKFNKGNALINLEEGDMIIKVNRVDFSVLNAEIYKIRSFIEEKDRRFAECDLLHLMNDRYKWTKYYDLSYAVKSINVAIVMTYYKSIIGEAANIGYYK